jgi:hypothetical protein
MNNSKLERQVGLTGTSDELKEWFANAWEKHKTRDFLQV